MKPVNEEVHWQVYDQINRQIWYQAYWQVFEHLKMIKCLRNSNETSE